MKIMILLALLILTACAPNNIYHTEGKVAIINEQDKYIVIDQTIPIPDVMPVMRMSYDTSKMDISGIKEGDNVSITIKTDDRKVNAELVSITKK